MAKKKAKVNKSQAIRNFLKSNSKAMPKEIMAGLKKQGVAVSATLVNKVKYQTGPTKNGRRKKKRGRPAAAATASSVSFDALVGAKSLADKLGGVDRAKRALSMLERLASP